MTDYPLVFTANHQDLWFTFGIALFIGLALFAIVIRLERHRPAKLSSNQRKALAMVLGFAALIASFTAISAVIQASRLPDLTVEAAHLTIGTKQYPLTSLKDARIRSVGERSMVQPNKVVRPARILEVDLRNGSNFRFSETHYPIEAILEALQTAIRQK